MVKKKKIKLTLEQKTKKILEKIGKKKIVSKTIVKPAKQIAVVIKKPIKTGAFFKKEFEEAKKSLFFDV